MRFSNLIKSILPNKEEKSTETKESQDITVNMDGGVGGSWTVKDDAEAFTADAKRHYASYTGVPAPAYLPNDEWFGESVLTEKGMDVVQQEAEIKQQEEERKEELIAAGILIEDEDIHQKMYEVATKNWNTVAETQGGSENFQEGPGGWNSGTGLNQFPR